MKRFKLHHHTSMDLRLMRSGLAIAKEGLARANREPGLSKAHAMRQINVARKMLRESIADAVANLRKAGFTLEGCKG